MKILFLDDRSARLHSALEKFGNTVVLVAYAKECIKKLGQEQWDIVCLDHDLGFDELVDSDGKNTGMEVVRYLCKHKPALMNLHKTKFVVHSANPVAAQEMVWALLDANYQAVAIRWEY